MNLSKVSSSQIDIIEKNADYLSFYIKNNFVLSKIIGEFDSNLKEIESLTKTKINLRGNLMIVRGNSDDRQSVVQILDNLIAKFLNTNHIEKEDIKTIFDVTKMHKPEAISTNSIYSDHDAIKTSRKTVLPRSEKQKIYVDALKNNKIVMALGPAGTGKTLLTIAAGLTQVLDEHRYTEIIMTRVTIPVGEDIGFLPGTEEEKMTPWMGALMDNLEVLHGAQEGGNFGRGATHDLLQNKIKIRSLNYMRGRTFLNRFIIIDEAQNLTSKQIKTLVTRAGPGSKIICLGDIKQIDTPYLSETTSGLTFAVDRFKHWEHSAHMTLTRGERSRLAYYAAEHL